VGLQQATQEGPRNAQVRRRSKRRWRRRWRRRRTKCSTQLSSSSRRRSG
jgi:hypothetical protein